MILQQMPYLLPSTYHSLISQQGQDNIIKEFINTKVIASPWSQPSITSSTFHGHQACASSRFSFLYHGKAHPPRWLSHPLIPRLMHQQSYPHLLPTATWIDYVLSSTIQPWPPKRLDMWKTR
jgi:hypothetical protein